MLKFYAGTIGSVSLASHIALIEAGLTFELHRLDYAVTEQRSPAYLQINPKGRVPSLATERGVITETPAILTYIAQIAPEARLAPFDDVFILAQLQSFMAYICSTAHPAHAHRMRGNRWSDDPAVIEGLKVKVPYNMAECFTIIADLYFKGPWVMGADYSIADPYLYTIATWMEGDGLEPKHFPKLLDHRDRMAERPAVKKAYAAYL